MSPDTVSIASDSSPIGILLRSLPSHIWFSVCWLRWILGKEHMHGPGVLFSFQKKKVDLCEIVGFDNSRIISSYRSWPATGPSKVYLLLRVVNIAREYLFTVCYWLIPTAARKKKTRETWLAATERNTTNILKKKKKKQHMASLSLQPAATLPTSSSKRT